MLPTAVCNVWHAGGSENPMLCKHKGPIKYTMGPQFRSVHRPLDAPTVGKNTDRSRWLERKATLDSCGASLGGVGAGSLLPGLLGQMEPRKPAS